MLALAAVLALALLEPSSPISPGNPAAASSRSCRSLPVGGVGKVAGWRLHRDQWVELCVPDDWVALDPANGWVFRPPAAAGPGVEIMWVDYLPVRDGDYGNFDQWLRDHRFRGKRLRLGRHRALRAQTDSTGGSVTVRTLIAVPNTDWPGGRVQVFLLSVPHGDPNLRKWTAIYDQMLTSFRLLAPAGPTGKAE
jgi:hypothetical protein